MCLVAVGFVKPFNTSWTIKGFATRIKRNGTESALYTRAGWGWIF